MNKSQEKLFNLVKKIKKITYINEIPDPNHTIPEDSFTYNDINIHDSESHLNTEVNNWYKELISEKEFNPDQNKKTRGYIYSECSIPRFKLKAWSENRNFKTTTKIENSDLKIISKIVIFKHFNSLSLCYVKAEDLIKWMNVNYNVKKLLSNHSNFKLLYELLKKKEGEYVYLHHQYYYWKKYFCGQHYGGNYNNSCRALNIDVNVKYVHTVDESAYHNLIDMAHDSNLYSEVSVINAISKDYATIDDQMYQHLRNMFKSKDKSNNVLALETITNTNINPSLHYILLLLKEFNNTSIYNLKERNHVSYKSLLAYLGVHKSDNISYDQIIDILIDKESLTKTNLKLIAEAHKEQLKNVTKTKHFNIKSITVSDDIINYFRSNNVEQANTNV